jgi:hypothetical protein
MPSDFISNIRKKAARQIHNNSQSFKRANKDKVKKVLGLYEALLSACQTGVGHRILMENKDKQDGIRSVHGVIFYNNIKQRPIEIPESKDYQV